MDQHEIRQLENDIGAAIANALGKQRLPESPRTVHFMAKAAVAVLEAVVEKRGHGKT